MKKIFILAAIAISSLTIAQTGNTESQKITIQDGVKVTAIVTEYRAKLDLSLQEARYSNPNAYENFDQMKEVLLKKITETGIKKSQITERKTDYYGYSRGSEGTTFELISTNEDEIAIFLSVATPGVTPRGIEYKLTYDESLFTKNISETMSRMKKRAETIAKELGHKVTKVNQVDLSQYSQFNVWATYRETGAISISAEYIIE